MPMLTPAPKPWVREVLKFWFEETQPEQWFKHDAAFDAAVASRFFDLHAALALRSRHELLSDERSALAAVIVFVGVFPNFLIDVITPALSALLHGVSTVGLIR